VLLRKIVVIHPLAYPNNEQTRLEDLENRQITKVDSNGLSAVGENAKKNNVKKVLKNGWLF
jgi:hypothetical protein